MSEVSLERLQARRRGQRGVVTKYVKEVKTLLEVEMLEEGSKRRLQTLSRLLEEKASVLKALDEEMLTTCPTEEIEREVQEAEEIYDKIVETRAEMKSVIPAIDSSLESASKTSLSRESTVSRESSVSRENIARVNTGAPADADSNVEHETLDTSTFTAKPKLPKIILPKFNGEITKFRAFWDSFESAVDRNPNLSAVDKFNYLNALLDGTAARSIQGLSLSEANYHAATEILKERFGRKQQIISAHMDDLLKIPVCEGDQASHLRFVYDKIHINVRGLEALGVRAEQYGSFLIPIIMAKLPVEVRLQVARVTNKDVWEVDELLQVIKGEVEAREISDTVKVNEGRSSDLQFSRRRAPRSTASALTTNEQNAGVRVCVYCKKEGHYSASCRKVSSLSARKDILKKEGRCFMCLAKGHRVGQCSSSKRCHKCSRRHHQSICESAEPREQNTDDTENNTSTATAPSKTKVLLQTARTNAYTADNKLIPVRVLFDSGSQRSYITDQLKMRLELRPLRKETVNLNVFGSDSFNKKRCDLVKVRLQGKLNDDIEILALSFPNICSPLPRVVELSQYPYLQDLELADCLPSREHLDQVDSAIDILIGSDYYWDIVLGEVTRESSGLVAVSSKFGWLLSGPVRNKNLGNVLHSNLVLQENSSITAVADSSQSLENELRRFWDTESLGITENFVSELREETFPSQIKYDLLQGHYKVGLPWKSCRPESTNHGLCLVRLKHLRVRLQRDRSLFSEYYKTFKTQLESKIIEPVPQEEWESREAHFLPHHGVIREDKETTKLRIVFDGSAKAEKHHYSLNNCLEKGPNLTPLIFDVLLKFRANWIGITADIEKAFHQIVINTEDRNMLRFLWFDDISSGEPRVVQYRFCRLVFGLTPSPAILRGVIQHHLAQYKGADPEVVKLLLDTLYVDDFPGGASNPMKAFHIYQQSKEIMKRGGFNLRKWRTNDVCLQQRIDEAEGEIGGSERLNDRPIKILGLSWDTQKDCFYFEFEDLIQFVNSLPPTKRSWLRVSTKIFDPLGFISPFTISAKMLFQKLCVYRVNWDEQLSGDALAKWNHLTRDFASLSEIRIPRCYFTQGPRTVCYQLHGFSDASEGAYAAVVYLRTVYEQEEIVEVNLVASRTRVAPIKKQSIPRLELLGATILARLLSAVKKSLQSMSLTLESYCWVDSFTTLCWIKNERQWKQYVQTRVHEIRKLTDKNTWRFCPGKINPADIPSRSCPAVDLVSNELWWNGPPFLRVSVDQWPDLPTTFEVESANEELVKNPPVITHVLVSASNQLNNTIDLEKIIELDRYGSWLRLLRVTAVVVKFIKTLSKLVKGGNLEELTATDVVQAEELWIKSIQMHSFPKEYQALIKKETVFLKQLNLFMDEQGVIRCRGRLGKAMIPNSSNNPILLPPKHLFSTLLIKDRHQQVHHNGICETLNSVRQTHWIIRGREAVKQVIRKCVVCLKHEGRAYPTPPLPDLPEERVNEGPPFLHTGVDFAGPLYVRDPCSTGKQIKVYISLFTCASTRAIHLEMTTDLSGTTFLQAFRRFTSRRGVPVTMLSDNAKAFKSVSTEIKKVVRAPEVGQYMVNKQITWSFIVEKAPWWGGFWERLVGTVKRCLKKTVGRATLTFEELRTILVEIEGTLNNRPLTYLYDEVEGISQPLTPADLIYGRPIAATANGRHFEVISTAKSLTRRARYQFRVLNEFTKQWRREYLLGLREHSQTQGRRQKMTPGIKAGDIVLLKDDLSPRVWWKLARVIEVLKGRDELVRAARIQVLSSDRKSTVLRRPIQHLIPLEVGSQEIVD